MKKPAIRCIRKMRRPVAVRLFSGSASFFLSLKNAITVYK